MCGRYYRRSDKQRIAEAYRLGEIPFDLVLPDWNFNVAPTTFQPVIRLCPHTSDKDKDVARAGHPAAHGRELVLMRWGLVPGYTKQLADVKGISTINARAETVQTSPVWRGPFKRRRCLVPADGFYEWKRAGLNHGVDGKNDPAVMSSPYAKSGSGEKAKQPYAFHMVDDEPFAFAGLWDAWKAPDGSVLESFSIVTTEANALMAPVHKRMPVILGVSDYDRWMDVERDPAPLDLLRPFAAEAMACAPCNPKVGNTRNNGPELLECPETKAGEEAVNSA
jgi:putative SOS response-associated peptidase YedK